jgi:hypothetical protein
MSDRAISAPDGMAFLVLISRTANTADSATAVPSASGVFSVAKAAARSAPEPTPEMIDILDCVLRNAPTPPPATTTPYAAMRARVVAGAMLMVGERATARAARRGCA